MHDVHLCSGWTRLESALIKTCAVVVWYLTRIDQNNKMHDSQSGGSTRKREWCGLEFPIDNAKERKRSITHEPERETAEPYDAVGRSMPDPVASAEHKKVPVSRSPSPSPSPMPDPVSSAEHQNVTACRSPSPMPDGDRGMGGRTIEYNDHSWSPTPPLPISLRLTEPCE